MTVPLVVLALFSLFAGWLSWPHKSRRFRPVREIPRPGVRDRSQVFQQEGKAAQLAAGEKEEEHTSPIE